MARFTYHGPVQSISLAMRGKDTDDNEIDKDKDGNEIPKFRDIDFVPGREISDLPQNNPLIVTMIARGLLRPVTAVKKPAKAESTPPVSTKGEK